MTLLRPTPSRRPWLNLVPLWALAVGTTLVVLVLVGLGLLFGLGGSSDEPEPVAAATCVDEPGAVETTPPKDRGRLNVYNATDRAGLAADTAAALEDRGFTVDRVDNDPHEATVAAAAEVRHAPHALLQARWVAAHVPGAELAEVERSGSHVDLVLGQTFDGIVGKKAARAAFRDSASPAC